MHNVYPHSDLKISSSLKRGTVELIDRGGHVHVNPALFIPEYGWIPCSKKWCSSPSTNPKDLVVVISDNDDQYRPYTSDIWISRTNVKIIDIKL